MTREEEIERQGTMYSDIPSNYIEWGDGFQDYDDRVYVEKAFIEGAKWADETMIEKAEKWLENFLEKTIQKPSINNGFTSDTIRCADYKRRKLIKDVLYDFKKAMEEQL